MEQIIRGRALSDSNSRVRSAALYTLYTFDSAKHLDLFRRALSDSSYLVEAAGLNGYLSTEAEDKDSIINLMLNIDEIDIALVLAEHFTVNREIDRYPWFLSNVKKMDGMDLWHFLQYFIEIITGAAHIH